MGLSQKYGSRFEKKIFRQLVRAKAVLPAGIEGGENPMSSNLFSHLHNFQLNIKLTNGACSKAGLNPVFFSRRNILTVRENKMGEAASLNRGAIWSPLSAIDSLMKQNFEEFL
ncbi:MAG: hypothetical protein JEY99_16900 [Spirochaetales bacterium]|nr:hypothetical protein [Spirochaetales bacterium]